MWWKREKSKESRVKKENLWKHKSLGDLPQPAKSIKFNKKTIARAINLMESVNLDMAHFVFLWFNKVRSATH